MCTSFAVFAVNLCVLMCIHNTAEINYMLNDVCFSISVRLQDRARDYLLSQMQVLAKQPWWRNSWSSAASAIVTITLLWNTCPVRMQKKFIVCCILTVVLSVLTLHLIVRVLFCLCLLANEMMMMMMVLLKG